jgi:hypothetical protein
MEVELAEALAEVSFLIDLCILLPLALRCKKQYRRSAGFPSPAALTQPSTVHAAHRQALQELERGLPYDFLSEKATDQAWRGCFLTVLPLC